MAFDLDSTFFLGRAGRYTNPANTNDRLPIVYGDLTDGSIGIWTLPFIDTVNDVYCFAGHETLSAANGNSITIYADNVTVNSANYTFSHSNTYESESAISTITFSTPPTENAVITARGKGKPLTSGSSSLMTNVIDIVNDVLVVESGILVTPNFNITTKTTAYNNFVSQGYTAGGVVFEDDNHWTIIYNMMSSFKGEAFVDADNKLVLNIDTSTLPSVPDEILSKGDIKFIGARLRRDNIINRLPSNYRYNYVTGDFKSHTDETAQSDTASINIYGTRKQSLPHKFYFTRDLTTVNTVQLLIVNSQKTQDKVWEVEFQDSTLKRVHMDIGDHIVTSFDLLFNKDGNPLQNEIFRILEINSDFNGGIIKFRCLDTGAFLTTAELLDGSKILDGSWILGGDLDTTVY